MTTRIYTSVNPLTINEFIEKTRWIRNPKSSDGEFRDIHGNKILLNEDVDGHIVILASENVDVSDILDVIPFHREN